MNASKIASLEQYRKERASRRNIIRVMFGFGKKPSLPSGQARPPEPQRQLSQRTFARLVLVHVANATVRN